MALVPVGVVGTASTDDVREGETFTSETAGKGVEGSMSDNGSGHISGPSDTLSGEGYYSGISNGIDDNGTLYINDASDSGGSGYYSSIQNNINSRSGNVDPADMGNSLSSGYYSSSISLPDAEDVLDNWGYFWEQDDMPYSDEFPWNHEELNIEAMASDDWKEFTKSPDYYKLFDGNVNVGTDKSRWQWHDEVDWDIIDPWENHDHIDDWNIDRSRDETAALVLYMNDASDHGYTDGEEEYISVTIPHDWHDTVTFDAMSTRYRAGIFVDGTEIDSIYDETKTYTESISGTSVDVGMSISENRVNANAMLISNIRLD